MRRLKDLPFHTYLKRVKAEFDVLEAKLRVRLRRRRDIGNFEEDLFLLLQRALVGAHMIGVRDTRAIRFALPLEKLELQSGIDIDELERVYETKAFRVSRDVSNRVIQSLEESSGDVMGIQDHEIRTIVETQSRIAKGAGEWNTYQQMDIWGFSYHDAGDNEVRPTHHANDGVTLSRNHDFWTLWWPPNGWNCRCLIIPEFDEQKPVLPSDEPPDDGFRFNPGVVFNSESLEPISFKAARHKEQALTEAQRNAVAIQEQGPVLDRAVGRSRVTRQSKLHAAVPFNDIKMKNDKMVLRNSTEVTQLKNQIPEKVIISVQLQPGDVGIKTDAGVLLPRDRPYEVLSRKKRKMNGKVVHVVTVKQL